MPYIGDGARGRAVSQKNEHFADVMDGGYIAHVWLTAPEPDLQRRLRTIGKSNQRYELTLGIGVAVDVPLSSLNGAMPG